MYLISVQNRWSNKDFVNWLRWIMEERTPDFDFKIVSYCTDVDLLTGDKTRDPGVMTSGGRSRVQSTSDSYDHL